MASLIFASAFLALFTLIHAEFSAEFVPNSYVIEVEQKTCGTTCRERIARSSGTDCSVKHIGSSRRGGTWLEVSCASTRGAESMTESSLMENARTEGVPIRKCEKNQVYTVMDLWGADEVDGGEAFDLGCAQRRLG